MSSFDRICALVVLFVSFLALVTASSAPPRPIKRLAHPSTLAIEILPRQLTARTTHNARSFPLDSTTLHHSDSFRLTLSVFGETFHLHLRPNDELIHPSARISYYTTDAAGRSVRTHTEPLLRSSVRAYWGEVVPAAASAARMREDTARVYPPGAGLGWARITVHEQGDEARGVPPVFEGAFSVNGVVHHVATRENFLRNRHELDPQIALAKDDPDSGLVIWRETDVMSAHEEAAHAGHTGVGRTGARTCGHDSHPWNTDPAFNPVLRKPPPTSPWRNSLGFLDPFASDILYRRDDVAGGGMGSNFANTIGQGGGCPSSQKVIYMGVAADCAYVQHYGSQSNATTQILTVWNTASALYKSTFNVSLGIVELQVQNSTCPSQTDPAVPWNIACGNTNDSTTDLNARLSLFSQWRGNKGDDGAGLWHLMSGCPSGSEVGVAWLGVLCQQQSTGQAGQFVSGTAVSTSGRVEWQVVSHEIGHNFGAIHDCVSGCNTTSGCCPLSTSSCDSSSQFIMSPVAEDGEMHFSPCTLGNICSLIQGQSSAGHLNTTCLVDPDPNRRTIALQMCGNGIVESGEDCDPGVGSNSTCCDASTCKFRAGAVCDPTSSGCCSAQCQFAPASQVCRPAKDEQCDTPESCTGSSAECPADVFAPNGKSCGGDGLACAGGLCTSLDQQCQQQGASMNLQKACPSPNDKSCKVSCQDPTNSQRCVVLDSLLVDGSPCGFGGTCDNGSCQAGSLLDTVKSWYTRNLQIAIPVTVIAGIIAIILLWTLFICIRRCCRRGGGGGYKTAYVPPPPGAQRIASMPPGAPPFAPPPPRPPMMATGAPSALQPGMRSSGMPSSDGRAPPRSNWVDATQWNGPNR